jgi:4-hydroxybenzoate polyprenyltransferase
MNTEQLNNLSNEELAAKYKSAKNQRIIHAFLLGFSLAIMLVGLFMKGFSSGFYIPLAVFVIFISVSKKANDVFKKLTEEMNKRNLK